MKNQVRKINWFALIGGILVLSVIAMAFYSHTHKSSTEDWAGWGQWAGGIGAFIAAYVALWISGREARRGVEAEKRRQLRNAHLIAVEIDCGPGHDNFVVRNNSPEPVISVQIARRSRVGSGFKAEPDTNKPFLAPGESWTPGWGIDPENVNKETGGWEIHDHDFEIQFLDLDGTMWRKRGEDSPTKVEKDDVSQFDLSHLQDGVFLKRDI